MNLKTRSIYFFLCICIIFAAFPVHVQAMNRKATISASKANAVVNDVITVTFGFDPKGPTRSFDFRLQYDSAKLQLVKDINSVTDLSGLKNFGGSIYISSSRVGINYNGEPHDVGKAISVKFKVLSAGTATIKIVEAADGQYSAIQEPLPQLTITISTPSPTTNPTATTTTTTTITTKATTKTTTKPTITTKTTTTSPKTVPSVTTVPTTSPGTTLPTEPYESLPIETTPETTAPVDVSFVRYDGRPLSVSESVPPAEKIPESFHAGQVQYGGNAMDGYTSDTLPYALFWLKADDDEPGRFYYYDAESGVFVPYFRSEWSSRFFTFAVVPKEMTPAGFELATAEVRGQRVPVFRPLPGAFVPYHLYMDGYRNRLNEGATSGSGAEMTGIPSGTDDGSAGGNPVSLPNPPENIVLIAFRMNDAPQKRWFLYDTQFDSLISTEHWPVPVWGSYLDQRPDVLPSDSAASETVSATGQPPETTLSGAVPAAGSFITLFGYRLPLWAVIVAGLLLLLAAAAIIFWVRAFRQKRKSDLLSIFEDDSETPEEKVWRGRSQDMGSSAEVQTDEEVETDDPDSGVPDAFRRNAGLSNDFPGEAGLSDNLHREAALSGDVSSVTGISDDLRREAGISGVIYGNMRDAAPSDVNAGLLKKDSAEPAAPAESESETGLESEDKQPLVLDSDNGRSPEDESETGLESSDFPFAEAEAGERDTDWSGGARRHFPTLRQVFPANLQGGRGGNGSTGNVKEDLSKSGDHRGRSGEDQNLSDDDEI